MKSPRLVFALVLAAAFVAGFAVGHRRIGSSDAAKIAPAILSSETAPAGSAAAAVPSLTVEQIVAQISSECRRGVWRRTAQWDVILARLSPADFARLVDALREFVLAPAQDELRRTLLARCA